MNTFLLHAGKMAWIRYVSSSDDQPGRVKFYR